MNHDSYQVSQVCKQLSRESPREFEFVRDIIKRKVDSRNINSD